MKRLEKSIIKKAVEDEFFKVTLNLNGDFRIDKDELTKILSSHDCLYKKSYKGRKQTIVACVWELTEEWLKKDPQILIIPYPIFNIQYDGWQIVTNQTRINELIVQITEEKTRKYYRKLSNLLKRIQKFNEAIKNKKILSSSKIRQIEKEELKPIKLLPYSYEEKNK